MSTAMQNFALLPSGSTSSLKSSLSASSMNSPRSRSLKTFKVSSHSARTRARLLPKANKSGGRNKPIVIRNSSSGEIQVSDARKSPTNRSFRNVNATDENQPPSSPGLGSGPAETLVELRRVLGSLVNKDPNARMKRMKNISREKYCSAQAHFHEELPELFNTPLFHTHTALDASFTSDILFETPSPISGLKRCHAPCGPLDRDLSSPRLAHSSGWLPALDQADLKAKSTREFTGGEVSICSAENTPHSEQSELRGTMVVESDEQRMCRAAKMTQGDDPDAPMYPEASHQAELSKPSGTSEYKDQAGSKKRLRHRDRTPQLVHSGSPVGVRCDYDSLLSSPGLAQESNASCPGSVSIAENACDGQKLIDPLKLAKSGPENKQTITCEFGVEGHIATHKEYCFARSQDMEAGGTSWHTSSSDSTVTIPGGLELEDSHPSSIFDPMAAVTSLVDLVAYSLKLVWKMARGA